MAKIFITKTKEPTAFTTREGALDALKREITEVELTFESEEFYPSKLYMGTAAVGKWLIAEKFEDLVAWGGGNPIRIAIVPLTNETYNPSSK